MKRLRVLALMHSDLVPPDDADSYTAAERFEWKTEYDVVSTLRELGHDVQPLGVRDELAPLRQAVESWRPHVVFNLLEEFHGESFYDHAVVGYLELLRVHYTGCNPRGLVLSRGKAVGKKLLAYHRIRVPRFAVFPMGHKVRHPPKLGWPLMVKSLIEDASLGISQASVVDTEEKLVDRVAFIHERLATDAIVEEFIPGREIYVGVLGNDRLQVLPAWELVLSNMPASSPQIATAKVKHDPEYQHKHGITAGPARDLPEELQREIVRVCKRIYRTLELSGYARLDFRLTANNELYFLEANPNPEIAKMEEFASSAAHAGISYPALLQKIVTLGISGTGGRDE